MEQGGACLKIVTISHSLPTFLSYRSVSAHPAILINLDQAQTHHAPHTVARALKKYVPASIRMPFAAATVTVREKTNKNNPHRADCFFAVK